MAFDFGAAGNMKHYNQVRLGPIRDHVGQSEVLLSVSLLISPSLCPCVRPQSAPPEYHVQDMKVPTALFSGGQDTLADPKDVAVLLTQVSLLIQNHSKHLSV